MAASNIVRYVAAGGVVVREGCVLVLRRPSRSEVRLPKGHVEPGEDVQAAALREVREESGYANLVVCADLGTQMVEFDHAGRHVIRTERYFLMELLDDQTLPCGSETQFDPIWLPWDEALAALTFEAEREWVRRARAWCVGRLGNGRLGNGETRQQLTDLPIYQFTNYQSTNPPLIALSTGSLYNYGTARVFELAAQAGYDGTEVLVDERWDTRQPAYLRRLSADYGLPIVALHSPFVDRVSGWPDDQLGRLRHTLALAQEVGASTVVTHLPFRLHFMVISWQDSRPRCLSFPLPFVHREPYRDFLHNGLAALEADTGITVAVENMPVRRLFGIRVSRYWFDTPAKLAGLPHLTLDTTHLGTWGLDPLAVYERLRERVAHVHLSNFDGKEHRSPPDGRLPLAELLCRMARDGYQGIVTVEASPDALNAADETQCLAALRRALAFCREHLG